MSESNNLLERANQLRANQTAGEPGSDSIKGPDVLEPTAPVLPKEDRLYVIVKKDAIDASNVGAQQAEIMTKHGSRMRMATIAYAPYLSEDIINSVGNVATGPEFPYHFAWIANDPGRMSRASSRGYRPVVITEERFLDKLVIGEDALSMMIDRSPKMMRYYATQKGVKLPGPLAKRLEDRWGFFIPPFVDETNNRVIWEGKELWFCEREIVQQRQDDMRRANRAKNPNQTDGNFLREEVGGQIVEQFEFNVDTPTNI